MKKIVIFINIIFLSLLFCKPLYALTSATPSVSPLPSEASALNQINKLKDRIASRVAQLKLVEKRGVVGVVTDSSNTQITISELDNTIKFIDVDEITKFASPSAKESFGISDIKQGQHVSILGNYNKQSRRILARFITVITKPQTIKGIIKDADNKNFTVTIISSDKEYVIDVEDTTRTQAYTKKGGQQRSGFSKIQIGQIALITGTLKQNEPNRISAFRILILPELTQNDTLSPNISTTPSAYPSSTTNNKQSLQ